LEMVLVLSSAARSPRFFPTIACAVATSSAVFMKDVSPCSLMENWGKDNKTPLLCAPGLAPGTK
jgi:hypothetical protein